MRARLSWLFTFVLLGLFASSARAVVSFDNLGPGLETGPGAILVAGSAGEFGTILGGIQFTAQQSGFFSSITVVVSSKDDGRPNDGLRFTLRENDADTPGAAIESVVLNDVCYVDGAAATCPEGAPRSVNASSTNLLSAGTAYWLIATSDLDTADFSWYLTSAIDPALVYIENGFTGTLLFDSPPGLRVAVTPELVPTIPEPATLALLGLVLLTSGYPLRRRR